jgi:16S rRNA (cytosine1402-N4)-methyltransferase
MEFYHVPVLRDEVIESLNINPSGIYVDATMGGAGHSFEIAKRLVDGKLIGFDQDIAAINASQKRLSEFGDKVTFVNQNFKTVKTALAELGIDGISGALMDLGVSSHQLDEGERGFSYQIDAPLDMRMDRRNSFSAYDVVNSYSAKQLEDIIFKYGEDRWARRIAEFIVAERADGEIKTTAQLVSVIKKAVPKGARIDGPHPAKRTFQAIRIEVNGELAILEQAVRDFADCLLPGGRLAIITFHSLEDRIVKNVFASLADGCTCPKEFPVCVCGGEPKGRVVNRKPIVAGEKELEENPRSRSAKLRVFEKHQ